MKAWRWPLVLLAAFGLSSQAREPVRWPPPLLSAAQQADAIHVYKAQRRMDLLRDGRVIATYRIVLGGAPVGHKRQQGDQRTPEGDYRITYRNDRSRFHLSLRVSYPDEADRRQAVARGVDPGGDIMIHGATPPGSQADWTEGCIAVTNAEMEAIWQRVPVGTPIRITP
jgi:murein L,D-transpeptidase YafK